MTGEVEADVEIDIGVDSASLDHPSAVSRRRRLPLWAAVLLALAVGWLFGLVTSSARTADDVVEPQGPASPTAIEPISEPVDDAAFDTDDGPSEVDDTVTVVLVQAPLRGVAIPTDLAVIDNDGFTPIPSNTEVGGATQQVIGQADQRLLVVDDSVVFMAVNNVMVFDPVAKTEPQKLAEAIYLIEGSVPGRVWAVTSGSDSVLDIDVRNRVVRQEYDLTPYGKPVGSFAGGLVLTPFDSELGALALWSPRGSIETLRGGLERPVFLDAASHIVAVHTPTGIGLYDTLTATFLQTDIELEPRSRHRTLLSPDGGRLAVVERGSVTELPLVTVIDLGTGQQVDSFGTSYAWQLQWASPTDLLYVEGSIDDVRVMLRNTSSATSNLVTPLDGPNYWVTTVDP